MASPFLGQLALVPYDFAPNGWAFCAAQILPISQFTALFALLGTNYGGNGTTNFALPDLRGRVPRGAGDGPGIMPVQIGELAGSETIVLNSSEVPAHTHFMQVAVGRGIVVGPSPNGAVMAQASANTYVSPNNVSQQLASLTVSIEGQNQPHENIQPYLTLNFIIAMNGVFPARS